jgi:hypothetical protein
MEMNFRLLCPLSLAHRAMRQMPSGDSAVARGAGTCLLHVLEY